MQLTTEAEEEAKDGLHVVVCCQRTSYRNDHLKTSDGDAMGSPPLNTTNIWNFLGEGEDQVKFEGGNFCSHIPHVLVAL